jgi:tetratricopeptide (TPR) repeat protein
MGHIFLSYSRDDARAAEELKFVLADRGFSVWQDTDRIAASEVWSATLESAIRDCDAMVLLMSPSANGSPNVANEIAAAQEKHRPIVPVLLEGEAHFRVKSLHLIDARDEDWTRVWDEVGSEVARILEVPPSDPPPPREPVLVVAVASAEDKPLAGVTLRTKGSGGTATTDPRGSARIRLAAGTRPGQMVTLQVVDNQRDYAFISPWEGQVRVPPFTSESDNFASIILAPRGDKALLQNRRAIVAIATEVNRGASQPKDMRSPEERQKEDLERVARAYNLPAADIDRAIRELGSKTTDPAELGQVALYERNYPNAVDLFSQAIERDKAGFEKAKESLEKAKEKLWRDYFSRGRALYAQGKYRASAADYQEALKLQPEDGVTMNNLAVSLYLSGDYAGAEPLSRRALQIVEKAKGPEHPETGALLNSLAELLRAKGDYAGAEPLYRRALQIAEKAQGPEHPETGTSLNNLAGLLRATGDYAGAEPLFERALAIVTRAFGPDHPHSRSIRKSLEFLRRRWR